MIQLLQRAKIDAEDVQYPSQQFVCAGFGGKYSCLHCAFGSRATTQENFLKCKNANQCADGKTPWIDLEPAFEDEINDALVDENGRISLYEKTRVLRMVKVNGMPVYLQLIQCNGEGYKCNTMCYYYPQRMQSKMKASKCASTRGCGLNGSFYCLLVPSLGFYRKMLKWNGEQPAICDYSDNVSVYNLRVQNVAQVGKIYVVTTKTKTTPIMLSTCRIINDVQGSANYGKMLSFDGTWIDDVPSARVGYLNLTQYGMEFSWWLIWHGLPLSTIYPDSIW